MTTFQSWGSSSREKRRIHRPGRVTRGSSTILNRTESLVTATHERTTQLLGVHDHAAELQDSRRAARRGRRGSAGTAPVHRRAAFTASAVAAITGASTTNRHSGPDDVEDPLGPPRGVEGAAGLQMDQAAARRPDEPSGAGSRRRSGSGRRSTGPAVLPAPRSPAGAPCRSRRRLR